MKRPKPVVLAPAHVSLLRLGREMGSCDIPTVELVLSPIWSADTDMEVDQIIGKQEREESDRIEDDLRRGLLFARHCQSCGARCTPFGTTHADDCDLDQSLTAQQRWRLRNPERVFRIDRLKKIKRRWAAINGRCAYCTIETPEPEHSWCRSCLNWNRDIRKAIAAEMVVDQRRAA